VKTSSSCRTYNKKKKKKKKEKRRRKEDWRRTVGVTQWLATSN